MTTDLTAAESAWLAQCCPHVPQISRPSAEGWISDAHIDRPYIVLEDRSVSGDPQVLLDGYFTYAQVLALAGIMRLREEADTLLPELPAIGG